jgi:hypothetical protein
MGNVILEVGVMAVMAMLALKYPWVVLIVQCVAVQVVTGGQYGLTFASLVLVALDGILPTPLLAYVTLVMSEYAWHRYVLHSERLATCRWSEILRSQAHNHIYGHHGDTFTYVGPMLAADRRAMRQTAGGNQLNSGYSRLVVFCTFLCLPSTTLYLATRNPWYMVAILLSIAASSMHLHIYHDRCSSHSFVQGHLRHHQNPTAGPYGLLPGGEFFGSTITQMTGFCIFIVVAITTVLVHVRFI